jgi:hypothetical protein
MTIPTQIQPYWHAMQTISSETGVPASRLGAHVLIESNGDARAVQKNAQGDSFGLMQIVPFTADPQRQGWEGHHALVRQIAGLSATATRDQVINALYDPNTNVRVGCAILADLKRGYGTWDKASSAFFLGNPDWRGADTVNGNTGNSYRNALNDWIVKIEAGETTPVTTMVRFEGASVDVPLDVPFSKRIVPVGQTNQRPGIHMVPDRYVQHETDDLHSTAADEAQYLLNGAEGRQASWHFTVDDTQVIQSLPLNEVAWHGGDGSGACNFGGIACELCVNMHGDTARMAKARANAEKVAAAAMLAMHLTKLVQHSDCCAAVGNPSGCHSGCPRYIREEGYWPTFTHNVQSLMSGVTPVPVTLYVSPVLVPGFDGTDKKVGNVTLYAAQRTYSAKRDDVPVLQFADPAAKPTRAPLKKGEAFTGWYITTGGDGKPWIVTSSSSRVPMDGVTPTVSISQETP